MELKTNIKVKVTKKAEKEANTIQATFYKNKHPLTYELLKTIQEAIPGNNKYRSIRYIIVEWVKTNEPELYDNISKELELELSE